MPTKPHTPDAYPSPQSGAVFSNCRRYRYRLWRIWDDSRPVVAFVMLNPSTADEVANDPTVERCKRRAQAMGYGAVQITNIFALRSTDPRALYADVDPVGPGNDQAILDSTSMAALVICAWGSHGTLNGRGVSVLNLLRAVAIVPYCIGRNADGTPRHALYVPYATHPFQL